jgi:hypothetical protein
LEGVLHIGLRGTHRMKKEKRERNGQNGREKKRTTERQTEKEK